MSVETQETQSRNGKAGRANPHRRRQPPRRVLPVAHPASSHSAIGRPISNAFDMRNLAVRQHDVTGGSQICRCCSLNRRRGTPDRRTRRGADLWRHGTCGASAGCCRPGATGVAGESEVARRTCPDCADRAVGTYRGIGRLAGGRQPAGAVCSTSDLGDGRQAGLVAEDSHRPPLPPRLGKPLQRRLQARRQQVVCGMRIRDEPVACLSHPAAPRASGRGRWRRWRTRPERRTAGGRFAFSRGRHLYRRRRSPIPLCLFRLQPSCR